MDYTTRQRPGGVVEVLDPLGQCIGHYVADEAATGPKWHSSTAPPNAFRSPRAAFARIVEVDRAGFKGGERSSS